MPSRSFVSLLHLFVGAVHGVGAGDLVFKICFATATALKKQVS